MISASLRLIASGLEPGDFRLDERSGTSLLLEVLKEKRTSAEEQEQRRQRDHKAPFVPSLFRAVNGADAERFGGSCSLRPGRVGLFELDCRFCWRHPFQPRCRAS